MNRILRFAAVLAVLSAGVVYAQAQNQTALTQPVTVSSQVKSLGLFKNGVVVVEEEIAVPRSGQYAFFQVPMAIHGTFFIESAAKVETRISQMPVSAPLSSNQELDYQKDLAGKTVTVYFNQPGKESVTGVVASLKSSSDTPQNASVVSDLFSSYSSRYSSLAQGEKASSRLILNCGTGQTILERSTIARIDVKEALNAVERMQSVMTFTVTTEKPASIRLFYLTKGVSWMPSYRIDTTDSQRLKIEQTAVIINQWKTFHNAEISLISGFPKIECENVFAPFSPGNSLNSFFQQLSNRNEPRGNRYMSQQIAYNSNSVMPMDDIDSSPAVSGEGPDIHFQKIGLRSMNKGDCLSISTGANEADYQRVVEWTIPDQRDAWGRYNRDSNRENKSADSEPWDMLRFRNPLPFPMTTAPASILADGKFYGQNSSFWASEGEMTKIPVTKSMSVRVKSAEFEQNESQQPQYVNINGNRYRKAVVNVELTVVNRRAESIKMVVNRRFSGDLIQTVEGAKTVALGDDLSYINRKREIQWNFDLPSGETKILKYSYSTLIR